MTDAEYVALRNETMQGYLASLETVTEYLERTLPPHESANLAMAQLKPAYEVRTKLLEIVKEQNNAIVLATRILGEIKADLEKQTERLRPEVTRG